MSRREQAGGLNGRFPLRSLIALLPLLAASACMPRFYDRSTVVLDTDDEAIELHYGELDGCLLRRQVPVEYVLRRPRYTLDLKPLPGLDSAPRIELRLRDAALALSFPGMADPPAALFAEQGSRYLVDSAALTDRRLQVQVQRGSDTIGEERLLFSIKHCRILSPTG